LTVSVVAGCAFTPTDSRSPPAVEVPLLTSPLANAAIGDPAVIAAAIERLPVAQAPFPDIVLEPVPAPPGDLVERLRAGFVLPNSEDAALVSELAYYAKHPEYIDRVFTR